jgi:hypothetical protein
MVFRCEPLSSPSASSVQPPVTIPSWKILQLGAGGLSTTLDINSDGTLLGTGDVWGGWISSVNNAGGNGNWLTPFNFASMPDPIATRTFWTGVSALVSAPSNSNTIVAIWDGNGAGPGGNGVLYSLNHGATWNKLSGITFTQNGISPNVGGLTPMIAFNPSSDSECYIGIPGASGVANGIWHVIGLTTTPVCTRLDPGTIPSSTGGYFGMAWHGNVIVIPIFGVGVYISTNGGSSFASAPATSMPTAVRCGGFDSGGTYYCCANGDLVSANIYRLGPAGSYTTWTQIYNGLWCNTLAVDPTTTGRLVVGATASSNFFDGAFDITTSNASSGTVSWAGRNTNATMAVGDVPWFQWSFLPYNVGTTLDSICMKIDYSGRLWHAIGIGAIYATTVPTDGVSAISWVPMSQGFEGMVVNGGRWMTDGRILLSCWDRPLFVIGAGNAKNTPPSRYAPNNTAIYGYPPTGFSDSVDFAQDGSGFMAGFDNNQFFSSSTGVGDWTQASPPPTSFFGTSSIAVFDANHWIVVDTHNYTGTTVAVASSSGVSGGMTVTDLTTPGNIPGGTTVNFIDGNTVTLSVLCPLIAVGDVLQFGGSINQTVSAQFTPGQAYYTTNGGSTWSTCPSPLSPSAGAFRFTGFHPNGNVRCVCYEQSPGFQGVGYILSNTGNIYKTTTSGSSWASQATTGLPTSPSILTSNVHLKSVPGQPGHLFVIVPAPFGLTGSPPNYAPNPLTAQTVSLYFSKDGGQTFSLVTNATYALGPIIDIGFSAAAPSASYPSLGIYGWINGPGGWVWDFWRCDNFNPSSFTGIAWTQMNWPWVSMVSSVEGDPSNYNRWLTTTASGNSSMGAQYFG